MPALAFHGPRHRAPTANAAGSLNTISIDQWLVDVRLMAPVQDCPAAATWPNIRLNMRLFERRSTTHARFKTPALPSTYRSGRTKAATMCKARRQLLTYALESPRWLGILHNVGVSSSKDPSTKCPLPPCSQAESYPRTRAAQGQTPKAGPAPPPNSL